VPGKWFTEEFKKWNASVAEWKKLQGSWKNPVQRKALLAAKKKKAEGEEGDKTEDKAPMEVNAEDLDVFAVEDVKDIGSGEPLFANFVYEDWALLSLRYELHMLVHAFRKDLDDPERPGFTEKHLSFYFQKYFKKPFIAKSFGVSDFASLLELIKDVAGLEANNSIVKAQLSDDTPAENFVKLTEDHRRERERRLDAGDESAKLVFTRQAGPTAPQGPPPARPATAPRPGAYGATQRPATYAAAPQVGKRPYSAAPAFQQSKMPRYTPNYTGYGR